MKFTLSWLAEHLETSAALEEITHALTDAGLEVESVNNPAESLGVFRICRVLEAVKHPDADRLRKCAVETWPDGPKGKTETVQVVCGAPNARAGLIGVFAPVGTHIPGTGLDLKAGNIRGVESNGMLCSERELMVSDDHDGIIDLPEDAPLGERYIDYMGLNDPVVEIAVTPNRPDALGIRGIARDLAAKGIGTLKPLSIPSIDEKFKSDITVSIDPDTKKEGCPVFYGRLIKGVKNGPSPAWLQNRLKAVGLRPISSLVDITNLCCIEYARPLHVFDADKVSGGLRVHFAKGGETITALDEKQYTLEPEMMAISDSNGVESIAGVMGGMNSGCSDETVNVFLESAYWDPITIAKTGRRLKINSDARYRFERGVDPKFTLDGLEIATQLILDLCGGEPSEIVVDGKVPDTSHEYSLDPSQISSLVGMDIPKDRQLKILESLGVEIREDSKGIKAGVPSWRPDIKGEADLVEEISRIASLEKLEGKPLKKTVPGVAKPILTKLQKREQMTRRTMAKLGYNECLTYSFIDRKSANLFGGGDDKTALENPISSEMSHLRPSLIPGLLHAARNNQARGNHALALFEVGPVFGPGSETQSLLCSGLLVGQHSTRNVHSVQRAADVYDAKADLEIVLAELNAPNGQINREVPKSWHPGRSGKICLGPKTVMAIFGEVHPKILRNMDVKGPAVGFTVFLEEIPYPRMKSATKRALIASDLQAVERDFSFIVDERVESWKLVSAARGADKILIESVDVFDEFTGVQAEEQFGKGKKSIAISVRLAPSERTLTDAEINSVADKVIEKIESSTGAKIRDA